MRRRPYQDKNILSDAELASRLVVMGPLSLPGYHPNTTIMYFLINAEDKPRFYQASQRQSLEKLPIFPLKKVGRLGTVDAFWQANMTQPLAAAVQYILLPEKIIVTHMSVRTNWRQMGINSRLIDCLQKNYQRPAVFENPTEMGQKFIDGYHR